MGEVTLRPYRAGDVDAMYALDVVCFEPAFRFSRKAMRGFAEAPSAVTVLAESDGELLGFCIVDIADQVGYVVTLDVATAYRRKGLAQRLMAEMEARVQVAGGIGMALHVYADNTEAIRFYEAMGYSRVGLAERFYGRGLNAIVYEKRL